MNKRVRVHLRVKTVPERSLRHYLKITDVEKPFSGLAGDRCTGEGEERDGPVRQNIIHNMRDFLVCVRDFTKRLEIRVAGKVFRVPFCFEGVKSTWAGVSL